MWVWSERERLRVGRTSREIGKAWRAQRLLTCPSSPVLNPSTLVRGRRVVGGGDIPAPRRPCYRRQSVHALAFGTSPPAGLQCTTGLGHRHRKASSESSRCRSALPGELSWLAAPSDTLETVLLRGKSSVPPGVSSDPSSEIGAASRGSGGGLHSKYSLVTSPPASR